MELQDQGHTFLRLTRRSCGDTGRCLNVYVRRRQSWSLLQCSTRRSLTFSSNLIDVQHTNLLTLRGKPSAEFATLLNTHFAPPPEPQSPIQASAPSTPNPNLSSDDVPEPPSPFTQAQIQAAQQSNGNGTFNSRTAHDKKSDTAVPQKIGAQSHQQDGDEEVDAAEEAWLKEISNGGTDFKWDEIKAPQDGLVVDLNDISAPSGGMRSASKTR